MEFTRSTKVDKPPAREYIAAMSVDVEDWFQVENLRSAVSRDSWGTQESRVVENTRQILRIFADANVVATFFVLGWVAERFPHLVREIQSHGHEIASHGYGHDLIYNLSRDEFRDDIRRSKQLLEEITGQPVEGYRAPSFSITDWAVDDLVDCGFKWDSSSFPTVGHDRYGKLTGIDHQADIARIRDQFYEVKISGLPLGNKFLPWGGGGYFRMIPYPVFQYGVRRILSQRGTYVFYIHPWEIDPGQPRLTGIKRSHRFRHYVNLGRCKSRLTRLAQRFRWTTISNLLSRVND